MDHCIDTNLKKITLRCATNMAYGSTSMLFPEEIRKICSPETTMPIA